MRSDDTQKIDVRNLPEGWNKVEGGRNSCASAPTVYEGVVSGTYQDIREDYAQRGIELPAQNSSVDAEIVNQRTETSYKVQIESHEATQGKWKLKITSDENIDELLG
ncbi:hypothetical protein [Candidatus Nanohalococcus occultus]|uniref:Uncharacterized protein n=1 Tax=Candidatus Nanohalococcus occultus TaxID=2978047 RepID=A0ABY8CK22_9ARCH|nr:hypothetical protein SVXNc_0662 [Candidatus Nanohaloarchaeota archaeon SVXNc]